MGVWERRGRLLSRVGRGLGRQRIPVPLQSARRVAELEAEAYVSRFRDEATEKAAQLQQLQQATEAADASSKQERKSLSSEVARLRAALGKEQRRRRLEAEGYGSAVAQLSRQLRRLEALVVARTAPASAEGKAALRTAVASACHAPVGRGCAWAVADPAAAQCVRPSHRLSFAVRCATCRRRWMRWRRC